MIVLPKRVGDLTWAHSIETLLAEQVENLLARSGTSDFIGVADHGPQRCDNIEAQGQLLLAFDIAPGHKECPLGLPTLAFQDERPVDRPGHADRAGDLVEHITGAGLAQVMHRQDRDVIGVGQLFPSLGFPASSVKPSGRISGIAQCTGGSSQESSSCRLKTLGFVSAGDDTGGGRWSTSGSACSSAC